MHRLASLGVCDVHVPHGRGDDAVAQHPLNLGQVHSRLKEVGRAGVAELVQAVKRNVRRARS